MSETDSGLDFVIEDSFGYALERGPVEVTWFDLDRVRDIHSTSHRIRIVPRSAPVTWLPGRATIALGGRVLLKPLSYDSLDRAGVAIVYVQHSKWRPWARKRYPLTVRTLAEAHRAAIELAQGRPFTVVMC